MNVKNEKVVVKVYYTVCKPLGGNKQDCDIREYPDMLSALEAINKARHISHIIKAIQINEVIG